MAGPAGGGRVPRSGENWRERQQAIGAILDAEAVESQEQLVRRLRRRGFRVTQSSVSRDLAELGVAKVDGRYVALARLAESAAAGGPGAAGPADRLAEVALVRRRRRRRRAAPAGGPDAARRRLPRRDRDRRRAVAGGRRHGRRRRHAVHRHDRPRRAGARRGRVSASSPGGHPPVPDTRAPSSSPSAGASTPPSASPGCAKSTGRPVVTVTVDTGGLDDAARQALAERARALGAARAPPGRRARAPSSTRRCAS